MFNRGFFLVNICASTYDKRYRLANKYGHGGLAKTAGYEQKFTRND